VPVTSVIKSTKLPSRLDYRVCPLLLLALDCHQVDEAAVPPRLPRLPASPARVGFVNPGPGRRPEPSQGYREW